VAATERTAGSRGVGGSVRAVLGARLAAAGRAGDRRAGGRARALQQQARARAGGRGGAAGRDGRHRDRGLGAVRRQRPGHRSGDRRPGGAGGRGGHRRRVAAGDGGRHGRRVGRVPRGHGHARRWGTDPGGGAVPARATGGSRARSGPRRLRPAVLRRRAAVVRRHPVRVPASVGVRGLRRDLRRPGQGVHRGQLHRTGV
ncbi:MAG: hypothetical protein AVDCRST_MAG52-725, partial [uncultured Blastococcus sp.]